MADEAIHRQEVTENIPGDDDDAPKLSSHALEALQEFLREQGENRRLEERDDDNDDVALVSEDWRLSQFWYNRETAETVSGEVLYLVDRGSPGARVACIACSTLHTYLKKLDPDVTERLLEYDKRFEQYDSDFIYYDYNQPDDKPLELKHLFPVIVADPPFLVSLGQAFKNNQSLVVLRSLISHRSNFLSCLF